MFKKPPKEIISTFPARLESLKEILSFVGEIGQKTPFSEREVKSFQLVTEEICTNIIRHAYLYSPGEITIKVSLFSDRLALTIIDQGKQFDPTKLEDSTLEQQVQTQRKGGLGLRLMKKLMDEVDYKYENKQNQLTLIKRFPGVAREKEPVIKKRSLRAKILAGAVTIWLGLVLVLYFTWGNKIESSVKERVLWNSAEWANTLAGNSAEALLVGDDLSLAVLTANFVKGKPDLVYVYIVDSLNTIWVAYPNPSEVLSQWVLPGQLRQNDSKPHEYSHPNFGRVYQFTSPVKSQERLIGSVHLGYSVLGVKAEIVAASRDWQIMTLSIFLIGLLGILSVSYLAAWPMRLLRKRIEQTGEVTLAPVRTAEDYEIDQILKIFRQTASKIRVAQKVTSEQEWQKKEFELAQEIRQSLVPKEMPRPKGVQIASLYNVAREIGGDYFDFIKIDENNLGIAVADIAGKGVSASLIMSAIRTALRLQAKQSKNPAEVLEKVDSFISGDMPKGVFVTMFYAVINLDTKSLACASAGHNPAYLLRTEENKLMRLHPRGLPLGLKLSDSQQGRETITLPLVQNDLLVLYTDGITECRNRAGEQFGANRLTEFIQAQAHLLPAEMVISLEQRLNQFSENLEPKDDITLVILKLGEVTESPEPGSRKLILKPQPESEESSVEKKEGNVHIAEPRVQESASPSENLPDIHKPIDN